MRFCRALLYGAAVLVFEIAAQAAPFVVFPNVGQLPSQDGRFVLRNTNREAPYSEYSGNFHSLFLEDTASGHSRKLCDYLGVVAVAWARNDVIIVTEYVSKNTSRALIFVAGDSAGPVVIDKPLLAHLVPDSLRSQLQGNDHVFVEAAGIKSESITLRVWGYGAHDAKGFRWLCEYSLQEGKISCDEPAPRQSASANQPAP
ncbi:MAG: hypothetical protein WCF68_01030 [Terriglobales bacterium]